MSDPSFKVTFQLDSEDVAYFRRLFRHARKAASKQDEGVILRGAKSLLQSVRGNRKTPKFVAEAMTTLDDLVKLVEDEDYRPPANIRNRVLGMLAYFASPADLIPDRIPVFGFLDDALMVKLIEQDFRHELSSYRKFRRYRDGAEQRPWTAAARQRLPKRLQTHRKKLREEVTRKIQRDAGKHSFFR